MSAAHVDLTGRLDTIAHPSADLAPVPGGPGDVTAFWFMVRDNVCLYGRARNLQEGVHAMAHNTEVAHAALEAVDEYLLSNWPLAAAEDSGLAREALAVEVSLAKRVKIGEEAELGISVKQRGQELPLGEVSFRILMESGRARWEDQRLFYWSSEAGPAAITVDVFVEPSGYGQGVARTTVEAEPANEDP